MSDVSRGPGWWLASDGKWYAPELHPDFRPPPANVSDEREPGPVANEAVAATQGTDQHETVPSRTDVPAADAVPEKVLTSDAPQGDGWWQGTDGRWYAPELYPSETPRADDWWQAANGRWYPPRFHPDYAARAGATTATPQQRDEDTRAATMAAGGSTSSGESPAPARADVGDPAGVVSSPQAAAAPADSWTLLASSGSLTLSHSQHEYAVYDSERTFGRWPLGDEGYRDAVEAYQARMNEIGR